MAYVIKDEETVALIRKLAKVKRKSIIDTIREASARDLERETGTVPLMERLRPFHEKHGLAPGRALDWTEMKKQSDRDWGER